MTHSLPPLLVFSLLGSALLCACCKAPAPAPAGEEPIRAAAAAAAPVALSLRHTVDLPGAEQVVVAGARALVLVSQGAPRLEAVDLRSGERVDSLALPGGSDQRAALDADAKRAVVAAGAAGLHVVDLEPALRLRKTVPVDATAVRLRGGFAYVTVMGGFEKVDLATGAVTASLQVEGQANELAWVGDTVYACTSYPAAVVVADADTLDRQAVIEGSDWLFSIDAAGEVLYLAASESTWRFDPGARSLERVSVEGPAMAAAGGRLYTDTPGGLRIYDAESLAPIGSSSEAGRGHKVVAVGSGFVCVLCDGRLRVFTEASSS